MIVRRNSCTFTSLQVFLVGALSAVLFARSLLGPTGALAHYRVSGLPDFDYLPETERLAGEAQLEETENLARYIKEEGLPGKESAAVLERAIAKNQPGGAGQALAMFARALRGEENPAERAAEWVLSDLAVYGNVRGVPMEAFYRVAGKDPDPLVSALATLGNGMPDAVDWTPAVARAARNEGGPGASFTDWMLQSVRASSEAKTLQPGLGAVLADLKALREKTGVRATVTLFRLARDSEDLAAAARFADKAPVETWLTVRYGQDAGVDLLRNLDGSQVSVDTLKLASRKGPGGFALLLEPVSKLYRAFRAVPLGKIGEGMDALAWSNPAWVLLPLGLCLACFGWCSWQLIRR